MLLLFGGNSFYSTVNVFAYYWLLSFVILHFRKLQMVYMSITVLFFASSATCQSCPSLI